MLLALAVVAVGGWLAVGRGRSWLRPPPRRDPPSDMIKMGAGVGTVVKAVYKDLKRSWIDWETLQKVVTVERRERQAVNQVFVEQVQELSTSYFVTDVDRQYDGADEINYLYVAGVCENGDSVVESWRFSYPLVAVPPGGGYVPIDERPLPGVRRREVFRGSGLGRIRSVVADPDGRFVMFLTRENPTLCRIDLPSGLPYPVLDQYAMPYMVHMGWVSVRQHVTEGRCYVLSSGVPWEYDATLPSSIIFLRDGNNDAVFDPPDLVDMDEWHALGYDLAEAWVSLYK